MEGPEPWADLIRITFTEREKEGWGKTRATYPASGVEISEGRVFNGNLSLQAVRSTLFSLIPLTVLLRKRFTPLIWTEYMDQLPFAALSLSHSKFAHQAEEGKQGKTRMNTGRCRLQI